MLRRVLAVSGIVLMVSAALAADYKPLAPLKLTKCQVEVGIKKPFKVVHVSDSHIVRVDNRDTEEIRAYALKRSYMERKPGCYYFGNHEYWLAEDKKDVSANESVCLLGSISSKGCVASRW